MDTLIDTVTDTTEVNDLLMPNLKLMLKLSHGTHTVTARIPMLTLDTDTDTHTPMEVITTLERDLLMPNQKLKANHGTDIVLMDTGTVATTMVKPQSFSSPNVPLKLFN